MMKYMELDPVDMINDWVTIAEDGYLTLRFKNHVGESQSSSFYQFVDE